MRLRLEKHGRVFLQFAEIRVCIFSFHYKLVRAEAKQQNSQILYAFRVRFGLKKVAVEKRGENAIHFELQPL